MTKRTHVFNDGGRRAAGYGGKDVGDCTTRAIAIATEKSYREVLLALLTAAWDSGDPNANAKVNTMAALDTFGWVHVKAKRKNGRWPLVLDAVPHRGRFIANMNGHMAAVIDGVVHDVWDSTTKPVYGYWRPR